MIALYNVLIFGTGKFSIFVDNVLNDNVKVLAYVDNDKSKWNEKKNKVSIISPDNISNYEYDYIIIGSQFNEEIYNQLLDMGVNKNKILQFSKILDNHWNYYKSSINSFVLQPDGLYEVLATGISYTALGFREDTCCKKAFKFAFGSQDLFYDYHTIKYLIENFKKKTTNVRYVIMGLSYYSFQYDMSLSAMKAKTVLYYEVLKNFHHFKDIERIYGEYDINKNIADKILRKNKDDNYDFKWQTPILRDFEDKETVGKRQAERDCNKNYPETVKENTEIFKEYLKLLKDNNIKPIVVVYPATKYYTKYFSKRIENEFHNIINEVKNQYSFQYMDYFRYDLFTDEDFNDVSHLNHQGAEKFTKILNEEIEW